MIDLLAKKIDAAAYQAEPVEQLSLTHQFTEEEAYEIQAKSIAYRLCRGEKLIGLKLGFTSEAKMKQMGVHDMIWGRLTDSMLIENGELVISDFIHPRAEPEICFRVKQEINREISRGEIPNFIDGIAAAIEVIDSRYQNFKFSLEDVIADNCSSTAFIVGDWQEIDQPIDNLEMKLMVDGEIEEKGNSHAILGDPWKSVIAAARLANKYKQTIPKGAYLMAGAATPAIYLQKGNKVSVEVENLGNVEFTVE